MKRTPLYVSVAVISLIAGIQFSLAQSDSATSDPQLDPNKAPVATATDTNLGQANSKPALPADDINADTGNTSQTNIAGDAALVDGEHSGANYVCTNGDLQRRVEIDLLEPPLAVPCEVNYYKDTEQPGTKTTLWTADNDSYYCENQAQGLIQRLEDANWSCAAN